MSVKQSISGYIRQNLAEIENKLHYGYTHEFMVEELNKLGIKINVVTFRTMLYRARVTEAARNIKTNNQLEPNQQATTKNHVEPAPVIDSTAKNEVPDTQPSKISYHPADIDAIINRKPKQTAINKMFKDKK